ncbi:DUF7577 domain-containing protein [Natronomonas sp.]|uniref:DUF7577 domain-containing protein n=1 Tax=Natronomonas sp. TaxID=2184060 RepID=UPI002FC2813C
MPSGELYVAIIVLLLLVALGAAIPVLKGIVIDGIERQRGDATSESAVTEDSPPVDPDGTSAVCPNCGTTNDPDFTYCRECGSRL